MDFYFGRRKAKWGEEGAKGPAKEKYLFFKEKEKKKGTIVGEPSNKKT